MGGKADEASEREGGALRMHNGNACRGGDASRGDASFFPSQGCSSTSLTTTQRQQR